MKDKKIYWGEDLEKMRNEFDGDRELIDLFDVAKTIQMTKRSEDGTVLVCKTKEEVENFDKAKMEEVLLSNYDNHLTILNHYCYDDEDSYIEALPRFRKDLERVFNGEFSVYKTEMQIEEEERERKNKNKEEQEILDEIINNKNNNELEEGLDKWSKFIDKNKKIKDSKIKEDFEME